MCPISVRIVLVSFGSVIFGSGIFVIVWLVALFVVVVVEVVDDIRGFGFSVVVVFVVDCKLVESVLFALFMVSAGVAVSVDVDVVVVVVVVVEVVDVVVVVGYETFVSKKLVTWSSTSTNSHDLKI